MVAETTVESGEPASKKPRLSDEDYTILRERLKSRKKLLIVSQIIFCIYSPICYDYQYLKTIKSYVYFG